MCGYACAVMSGVQDLSDLCVAERGVDVACELYGRVQPVHVRVEYPLNKRVALDSLSVCQLGLDAGQVIREVLCAAER